MLTLILVKWSYFATSKTTLDTILRPAYHRRKVLTLVPILLINLAVGTFFEFLLTTLVVYTDSTFVIYSPPDYFLFRLAFSQNIPTPPDFYQLPTLLTDFSISLSSSRSALVSINHTST